MSSITDLAKDLTNGFPRSPRERLAGYVIAARCLDKCRAAIAGTLGEYHFDCPLDRLFLDFTGIEADALKAFVATGANDEAVAGWIEEHAEKRECREIIQWNNKLRDQRISELPIEAQEFLEGYIPECLPAGAIVHVWFDIYDIEEGRMAPC